MHERSRAPAFQGFEAGDIVCRRKGGEVQSRVLVSDNPEDNNGKISGGGNVPNSHLLSICHLKCC